MLVLTQRWVSNGCRGYSSPEMKRLDLHSSSHSTSQPLSSSVNTAAFQDFLQSLRLPRHKNSQFGC